MSILLFIAALGLAVLSGRVTLIMVRGGMVPEIHNQPLWRGVLGALILPCQIALVVWCFATFPWYFSILGILIIAMLAGLLVTGDNWVALFRTQPAIDVLAIVPTVVLWWKYYPF